MLVRRRFYKGVGQTPEGGAFATPGGDTPQNPPTRFPNRGGIRNRAKALTISLSAGQSSVIVPADPPAMGQLGGTPPFVPRDPYAPPRTLKFIDVVQAVLNSLIRQGDIWQSAPTEYRINTMNYAEARNPGLDDDVTAGIREGSTWVNTAALTMFVCVDNTAGAANWKSVTIT